jgi:biopolymer transport protein ExbD
MKILLFAATGIFLLISACKDPHPTEANTLSIDVSSSSTFDFRRFLEAITLLISDEKNSVVSINVAGTSKLSFRSTKDFEFDPVFIHVLQDKVAIGSGSGRQLLTVPELQSTLEVLAEAASSAGSEGFVHMHSDEDVSLQFGLKILNVIDAAGIQNVMLATEQRSNTTIPSPQKKPSSPTSK